MGEPVAFRHCPEKNTLIEGSAMNQVSVFYNAAEHVLAAAFVDDSIVRFRQGKRNSKSVFGQQRNFRFFCTFYAVKSYFFFLKDRQIRKFYFWKCFFQMFIRVLLFCECERVVAYYYFIKFFIEIFQNGFQRVWMCVCIGEILVNRIHFYEKRAAVFLFYQFIDARLNKIYGFFYVFLSFAALDNRN